MARLIPETDLPDELSAMQAVEAAYASELQRSQDALLRGLAVMVECDKGMVGFFYACLRTRLRRHNLRCNYIDGRIPAEQQTGMPQGLIATMIGQLREAVRGATHDGEQQRVMVLPHLDLLTTSSGALTSEAREVIPLLYENPNILWLGFRDTTFQIPKAIRNLFPHRISILGIPRDRLEHLVTKRESRKLGRDGLDVYRLYKSVSGVHAVRLRSILASLEGEDYPPEQSARAVWDQIRQATLEGGLVVPEISLHDDIGGYARVKDKLQREILDVITHKETLDDPKEIARVEQLIPRGMLFWGPPGTGKTLFAKSIATALGAAVQVVNGPELKSRWVGESEENLRQIFVRARQSAPALIIFDELDSFAAARGTFTGSGVEHSMVNQLLTELDGFRDNEMVFVVGTTNFVESIDAALLRPGRLEFELAIPFPGANDRRAIFDIYDRKLELQMSEKALEHCVRISGYPLEGGGRWSGDHIQALCRAIARRRIRMSLSQATQTDDVEAALEEGGERPEFTTEEEKVIASHEAGHAVVAMYCPHVPPIDRISIRGDLAGALGFVSYSDPANRYVTTQGQMLDGICTLFGGREAEALLLDDLSIGAGHDIERATAMARALVERFGLGSDELVVRDFAGDGDGRGNNQLSEATRERLDHAVQSVLTVQRARAAGILEANRDALEALRDLLLDRKVLDAGSFAHLHPPADAENNPDA